jgi:hypothetical protein
VKTERGSDPGFASSGTMGGISAEGAGMDVVATVSE